MPARPRHCNGQDFTALSVPLVSSTGKASVVARSQETTLAHARTTTLEGGLAPRGCALSRVLPVARASSPTREDALLLFRNRCVWKAGLALVAVFGASACSTSRDQAAAVARPGATRRGAGVVALTPADTDDFGAPLPNNAEFASRVVSLNPTATEIIFAIGQEHRLVGRSKWDAYPPRVQSIASVGDGIRPNVEAVLGVRPTLVVLYATAENRPAARALAAAGVRTLALRVDHIAQFASLTRRLGVALGVPEQAAQVSDSVQVSLDVQRRASRSAKPVSVVWPLWQSPVMVVGRGSYLDELIEIAGGRNVFHDIAEPSPTVSIEEIARRDPDFVIASRTTAKQLIATPAWRAVRAIREGRIVIDDPALSGRPSVVLGMAAHALAAALRISRDTVRP